MELPSDRVNWLFLDLNSYFASVEQQVRPELRGKPIGVVPLMAETTCCIAASYEAKAFGVKTGTKVAEARLMCPGIIFVEARPSLYVRYHDRIVEAVESCIPVATVMSIDEMACELSGTQHNSDNALALAGHIKKILRASVGDFLRCSIGIAPNRFLAKVASDMQKPDGLTLLRPSDLPERLHSLSLRDLPGIGANMEARLNHSGILTMEQLCGLDKEAMREAWGGIVGERFWNYVRGVDVDEPETTRRSIGHSHVLGPDLRTRIGAQRVSHQLLNRASIRVRKIDYWVGGMTLTIHWIGGTRSSSYMRIDELQDTPTLLKALNRLWEKIPKTGIPLKVGVTFNPIVAPNHHTLALFDPPKRQKINKVMDAINLDIGKNTVYFGALQEALDDAPARIAFNSIPEISEM